MPSPSVVFCTTCKGRLQHLSETLPRNLTDCPGAKFVVLDYNSRDGLQEFLRDLPPLREGRLVVYSFPTAGPFRMAHAKNMAHRCALLEGADILVNLDADNFTGPGFDRWIAEQFQRDNVFAWARMVRGELSRGISGRIAVTRQAFLKTGGYDEKYDTWGPDDKDFNARLRRLGCDGIEIDPRFLDAIRHNDKMRFREYKHARTAMGEDEFNLSESDATIANFGNFGCGTLYRDFSGAPIELEPLPTRIFGIGMHKTATTSLHTALHILGFDSAHWKDAHWAKRIFEEMTARGRSFTLEHHYALSDLPITILYEKLDRAYPGSKFILTTRHEGSWLESVRKHWSHEHNRFRADWSKDPFTHRIHREVYGTKGFDAEIMLSRYRRHNAEVQDYFRARPADLLTIDAGAGGGWPELCRFLVCAIPSVPYPVANRNLIGAHRSKVGGELGPVESVGSLQGCRGEGI